MEADSKNNDSSLESKDDASTVPEKKRKKYEWTEKRIEAFNKMRKGLEEKTLITKQLKEQKKKEEKDAIRQKVKEIMSGKAATVSKAEELSSSDSQPSSESEEERKPKKEKKEKKKVSKKPKKRKQESSSESESEPSEAYSSEEDRNEREVLTSRQREQYRRDKIEHGKVSKRSPFVNPLDRFILL